MEKNTLDETYKMIPEKYNGMMTPDYAYGCKRRIFDDGWRACMSDPRFTLTNRKIVGVGGRHIALGAPYTAAVSESETVEEKTPADVIVLTNSLKARAGYTRSPCWPRRSLAARCMGWSWSPASIPRCGRRRLSEFLHCCRSEYCEWDCVTHPND
jgi:hypothetical protein